MKPEQRNTPDIPPYQILRSQRKTISLEIVQTRQVVIRCPLCMTDKEVEDFVRSKAQWIRKVLAQLEDQTSFPVLTLDELQQLGQEAMDIIPKRVAHFAALMGVTYKSITIRNQRSRWGSCSNAGGLNFNCLLMLSPPEVVDYVVVHELCHRKEMNHSPRFWAEVERVMPDYARHRQWLKDNGRAIMARMQGRLPDGALEE